MIKRLILILVLLGIISALNCLYQTDSSCTAAGCSWTTNQTCIVGNGNCQDNQAYYQNECVNCASLASNNCSQICTQFYFSKSLVCTSCIDIDSKCLTCSSSECFACSGGFSVNSLYKTQCLIDFCKIRYCQQCDSSTTCYLCSNGYTPGLNQTFCSISSCQVKHCLYCSNDYTCVTCVDGYLLSKDSTYCTLICNDPYCGSCLTYSTCTSCKNGYQFSKVTGYCILSCDVPYCSTCDLSTTCVGCSTGYKLSTDRTLCFLKCSDSNCAQCQDPNVCKSCALGYTLQSNGICVKAICYIDSCLACNNSLTCAVCSSISLMQPYQQQCKQNCLQESYNKKCKTCKDNTTCLTCIAGYSLNQTTSLCYAVCKITFCVTCLTSNLCSFCSGQYSPIADGTQCDYDCGILNCQTCNSSRTCETCNGIYTLSAGATSCNLNCSPGSYADIANSACKTCTSTILNCATCFSSNSTIICSLCFDLYYLTSSGVCKLCSKVLSNCLLCLNPTSCISCASGYSLVYLNSQYQCILPYSCNVSNCLSCNSNNPSICTTCETGYYLTSSNLNCTLITCVQTQYYDPVTGTCKCRVGTYVLNNACAYCNLDNCVSCNNGGCISCKTRYYANSGQCNACMNNCINCTTDKTCLECDYGYEYQDGSCVSSDKKYGRTQIKSNVTNSTTQVVVCPPGCQKCIYYLDKIQCTFPMSGYAIDSNGEIVRCSDQCATCASLDYSLCTSCYGASILKQGTCIGCSDPNALTCPRNLNYAATCKVGFTSKGGVCRQCAENCLLCTVTGPSQCDNDGCTTGYVNILYTTTCTKCFSSCATCLRHNPGVCLSCGPSSYLSNSSICAGCPSSCLSCSSSAICTSCPSDNILQQEWCYPSIGFPCATQSRSNCTSCYFGYLLISGVCQSDNSCNGTATCLTCPKDYFLNNRRCFPCTLTVNCDYCQPSAPTICLQCSTGYYLVKSNSSCTLCRTGCVQCLSAKICVVAQTGYYLQIDSEGDYTGNTSKCDVSCAACTSINSCDTCADNYQKLGVNCVYYKYLQALLVLGPVAFNGSSSWFKNQNENTYTQAYAYLNTQQIISAIASSTNTPSKKITIQSVTVGSISVSVIIQSDQNQDFTAFSDNFDQTIVTMTQFSLLSKSVVVNGQDATSSSANLGVLLGVLIPLLVLLIIVIIGIKMKLDDSDEKTIEQTQKQIQNFQM